jgi:hypothetical protein
MTHPVAFKCTYNDGDEGVFVGFAGTCSKDNIERNVRNKRVWCSSPHCKCRKFYDTGMKGAKPSPPCYESNLFRNWRFGAGGFHTGAKVGPIHLTKTGAGKFAILTTRFPGEPESERHIIGLFQIAQVENQNIVIAGSQGRIRLPLEEAKHLFFWAYCSNRAKKPDWRTGLFRYLADGQVHRILEDVASSVRDEGTRNQVEHLISGVFAGKPAPPAAGCLPERSAAHQALVAKARKYGPGGEGEAHKALKKWISEHPEVLGLTDVNGVSVEHPFVSGDAADIVFSHSSGSHTVIEIETTTPLPGAHQCIKYRALLCAERGIPLDADQTRAILVAWSIPPHVQAFCGVYGILCREYALPAQGAGHAAC